VSIAHHVDDIQLDDIQRGGTLFRGWQAGGDANSRRWTRNVLQRKGGV